MTTPVRLDDLPDGEARAAADRLPRRAALGRRGARRPAVRGAEAALRGPGRCCCGTLSDDELEAALARHPRIGERAGAEHDAAHSAREQSGVDRSDAEVLQRLADGNRAYEERFDRVFLIRAAGRDSREILAELERRLGNDDATERDETVDQLRQIALLRLDELL